MVRSGGGTTGNAEVVLTGRATCVFENATVAGHYVIPGTATNGNCRDSGATFPATAQAIGRVLTTNVSAGTYELLVASHQINATGHTSTMKKLIFSLGHLLLSVATGGFHDPRRSTFPELYGVYHPLQVFEAPITAFNSKTAHLVGPNGFYREIPYQVLYRKDCLSGVHAGFDGMAELPKRGASRYDERLPKGWVHFRWWE